MFQKILFFNFSFLKVFKSPATRKETVQFTDTPNFDNFMDFRTRHDVQQSPTSRYRLFIVSNSFFYQLIQTTSKFFPDFVHTFSKICGGFLTFFLSYSPYKNIGTQLQLHKKHVKKLITLTINTYQQQYIKLNVA